ncbi:MAG: SUMF1/EgtB/PvdO family nonheme iron enzyme [Anaerolineaceae bacterium]|nr:SUMF1/EgtB/PvdO family nonheme iron enzyme [Anaerolineaceae bacterium]
MSDVFISYSRKDITFVRFLHQALKDNQFDAWIDWQNIPPSADWLAEVYQAIEQSDTFIFIISNPSLASEICSLEIAHAVKHNKRLIPIVIQNVEASKVPKELSALNWIFFDEESKYKKAIEDLITAITIDQNWVRAHTRFQIRSLEWQRKEQDRGLLLRGGDLTEAETWLANSAGKDPEPTTLQTQYILKSREDTTRRQRIILVSVTLGLVTSIALGILAWTQRNVAVAEGFARATQQSIAKEQRDIADEQRVVAEARQLAALSQTYVESNLDLAILLAIEGHQRDPNYLTLGSLLKVLQEDPYTLRQFHIGQGITGLAFHPTEDYIVAASSFNIYFFDPVTGIQIFDPIAAHTGVIHDIEMNNQGTLLASSSEDGTIKIWDLKDDRKLLTVLLENDSLSSAIHLAFSPDDSILAAATENKEVWVWDTNTFKLISKNSLPLKFENKLDGLLINQNGDLIIVQDGTVEIWDYQSGEMLSQLAGTDVNDIQMSPTNLQIAGFNKNETRIYIWDAETYEQLKNLKITSTKYDYSTTRIKFHPLGKLIFLINDEVLQYINWENPESLITYKTFPQSTENYAKNILEFSHDGKSVIHAGTDGTIYLCSVYSIDIKNDPFYGFQGDGYGLSLSLDETTLAATGQNENKEPVIYIWSFPDLEYLNRIELNPINDKHNFIYTTLFHPEGYLIFSEIGEKIKFYNPDTLIEISPSLNIKSDVDIIELSTDGRYLAVIKNAYYEKNLQLWDLSSGELYGELHLTEENKLHHSSFVQVAFSPDGRTIAAGLTNGLITFWDINTLQLIGDPIIAYTAHAYSSTVTLEYSHDGKLLATSDENGQIMLWDTNTHYSIGVPMQSLSSKVNRILFNQDDTILYSVNDAGEINLWDVATQQPIGLPISGTNARALAASLPNFDAYYGRDGHTDPIKNMVLTSDGKYLITMDSEGKIRIWDFSIASLYEKACYKAGRNLTQNEWGLYFPNEPYHATCPQLIEDTDQSTLNLSNYTSRLRETDGMTQVFVPAGEFEFGSRTWTDDGSPYHILYLEAFWIDQTEVTNAQYQACVESKACTPPASSSSVTRSSNYYGYDTYNDYPVIFVSFAQAEDYCKWVNGRVPDEVEWEKAARGTSGFNYPWGNTPPSSSLVNFHFFTPDTTPVGSFPLGASPYGALDMAGNVREWAYDYHMEGDSELPTRIRGGAYNTTYAYVWMAESTFEGFYWNDLGFRCINND